MSRPSGLVSSSPSSTDLSVCGLRMANAQHDALDHIVFVQSKIHTRRERVFADYSIDFVKTAVAAATNETSQVHFGREENVKLDNKSSAHMFHTERRMRRRRRISMFWFLVRRRPTANGSSCGHLMKCKKWFLALLCISNGKINQIDWAPPR